MSTNTRAKSSTANHPRSLKSVADRNGVCIATVYNEIKRGNLEVTKIGARTTVTPEQEQAWLDRGRYRAPGDAA